MIISRTPFRVSFLGGGTDLPEFYKEEEGAVLSTAINKYMYITVNDRFDSTFRLAYSKTEITSKISEIDHKIFRVVLEKYWEKKDQGLEILSMADIPSGTGLGSSSSFTVGLLHALKAHLGIFQSAETLAAEASQIEIEELKEPIGKQDQYAAAYGGVQFIRFLPSGKVSVEPVIMSPDKLQKFESCLLMFYTGLTRSASSILAEQKANTLSLDKRRFLREMKSLAEVMRVELQSPNVSFETVGKLMDDGWLLKKEMATKVSTQAIDQWYERGKKAGAWGGKILGAGGGGFLLFLAPPEIHDQIKRELSDLRAVPIKFEPFGSRIIFVGNQ
jgi:D-glycero-alpha-D-manno-heptose-7-phosphate kinase